MCDGYQNNFEGTPSAGSTVISEDATSVRLPNLPCRYVSLSVLTTKDGRIDADGHEVDKGGDPSTAEPYTPILDGGSTLPKDAANGSEVYFGFGESREFFGQLFPGDRVDLLPVNNLNQIFVRTAPGRAGVIHWVAFL